MADFLRSSNKGRLLQDSVGFADPSLSRVTWLMQRELPAQFAAADSMELLANPGHPGPNPSPEPELRTRTPSPES
jgi:hypothetical protein